MALKRTLAAFDMDNTINTLFLEGVLFQKLTLQMRNHYYRSTNTWEQRISDIMSNHTFTLKEVTQYIKTVGVVPGMKQMLNNLNSKGVENIIISGGNDLFIKIYLKEHGLDKYFSAIIANKMNQIEVKLVYESLQRKRSCLKICKNNVCKKYHLQQYAKLNKFQEVFMIGDGQNDHCAFSSISQGGAMVRKPSQLSKIYDCNPQFKQQISCPIYQWSDGFSLNTQFQKVLLSKQSLK